MHSHCPDAMLFGREDVVATNKRRIFTTKAGLDFSRHKKEGIDPGHVGFWHQKYVCIISQAQMTQICCLSKPSKPKTHKQIQQIHDSCSRHSGPEVGELILGGAACPELGDLRRPLPQDECG